MDIKNRSGARPREGSFGRGSDRSNDAEERHARVNQERDCFSSRGDVCAFLDDRRGRRTRTRATRRNLAGGAEKKQEKDERGGEKIASEMRIFRANAYSCHGDATAGGSKWRVLICINPAITGSSGSSERLSSRDLSGSTDLPGILGKDDTCTSAAPTNSGQLSGERIGRKERSRKKRTLLIAAEDTQRTNLFDGTFNRLIFTRCWTTRRR